MRITIDLTREELVALKYVVNDAMYSGEPTKDIDDRPEFDEGYNDKDPGYMKALERAAAKVAALEVA